MQTKPVAEAWLPTYDNVWGQAAIDLYGVTNAIDISDATNESKPLASTKPTSIYEIALSRLKKMVCDMEGAPFTSIVFRPIYMRLKEDEELHEQLMQHLLADPRWKDLDVDFLSEDVHNVLGVAVPRSQLRDLLELARHIEDHLISKLQDAIWRLKKYSDDQCLQDMRNWGEIP